MKKSEQWQNRIKSITEESPDQLLANPANFRIHPKGQQDALSGVLNDVGFVTGVIQNDVTGHIIDGHLRCEIAISKGQQTIPVIHVELSEAEEKEILATFDPIGAMAAADKEKLDSLLREVQSSEEGVQKMIVELAEKERLPFFEEQKPQIEEVPIPDKAEELQKKWQVVRGQVWEVPSKTCPGKSHRVMCGDSTSAEDVALLCGGRKATLVFTDPPYGVSIGDKNKMLNTFQPAGRCLENIASDTLSPEKLKEMLLLSFTNTRKMVCADDCSVFVCSPQNHGGIMMMMMMEAGLETRHVLQWVKNCATFSMGQLDYDYQHEPILFTWIKTHKRKKEGQFQTTVWNVNKPKTCAEHPTMKPVELPVNAILNHTDAGDNCYDPFLGSGTTLIAAEQTGRICMGMEIAEKYCAVILERCLNNGLKPRLTGENSQSTE